ncbi:hypothetical protein PHLCEN_2v9108 [Hermanssonia centrifuga]|uniref:Uncharacterized protein n=1 Tax=Hermanssonia centrifuga TaxID=98765 RepID=A0A2R6NRU2_9APHY|nr:hypothetical protein PHLCEN_2v9108 [Hermanssonia centrifuga]
MTCLKTCKVTFCTAIKLWYLGDTALAIGPAFEPYLGTTMKLRQASLLTSGFRKKYTSP